MVTGNGGDGGDGVVLVVLAGEGDGGFDVGWDYEGIRDFVGSGIGVGELLGIRVVLEVDAVVGGGLVAGDVGLGV